MSEYEILRVLNLPFPPQDFLCYDILKKNIYIYVAVDKNNWMHIHGMQKIHIMFYLCVQMQSVTNIPDCTWIVIPR